MSKAYAMEGPIGKNGAPTYGANAPAPIRAIARYVNENGTASSVISLTHDTTAIEIGTGGTTAVMRWVTTADTQASVVAVAGSTANIDHVIAANTVRRFVVPIEAINNAAGYGSVVGANREFGLFQRVAWKTQGIASVLLTEYGSSNSY